MRSLKKRPKSALRLCNAIHSEELATQRSDALASDYKDSNLDGSCKTEYDESRDELEREKNKKKLSDFEEQFSQDQGGVSQCDY